jgi:hypothetical protein
MKKQAGKGDRYRKVDISKYDSNYDQIKWKPRKPKRRKNENRIRK